MSSRYEVKYLKEDEYEEWDDFVDESPQGCIFCRSWWFEAVCPGRFKILALRKNGKIIAGIPLPLRTIIGHKFIYMSRFTQTLGALLLPWGGEKYEKKLSEEISILNTLVENMPKFDYFSMSFHYNFTNWLPFYWAGYRQTTVYTYVIEDLTDLKKVFSDFNYSKKKNIKKAEQLVTVRHDLPSKAFYTHHVMTLRKQGECISYGYDFFKRIYDAVYKNSAGKVWYAIDKQQNIHAAIFVVFDNKSAYYLISSIDPRYRNSGAVTLLLRDAIIYVSKYTQRFDFEGSMIHGVENSFRKFGAIQKPYFIISRNNCSPPIKILLRLRSLGIRMVREFELLDGSGISDSK